jgi:hypothetical protein
VPFAGLRARDQRLAQSPADEAVLRWLLRGIIAITAAVLVLDYTQRQAQVQTASLPPVTVPEPAPDISRTAITELLPLVQREHKPLLQRG